MKHVSILQCSFCVFVHEVCCRQWSLTNPHLTHEVCLWCVRLVFGAFSLLLREFFCCCPSPASPSPVLSFFSIMFQTGDFGVKPKVWLMSVTVLFLFLSLMMVLLTFISIICKDSAVQTCQSITREDTQQLLMSSYCVLLHWTCWKSFSFQFPHLLPSDTNCCMYIFTTNSLCFTVLLQADV